MPKLTKKVIDSYGEKEKIYTIWDTEVKGFGCKIRPTGKKTYIFLYRTRDSHKLKYLTIGIHGSITAEVAREIAKGWSADVARGIDPKKIVLIKKNYEEEKEESITFEDFFEIFTEKHRNIQNKALTLKKEKSIINKWIMPFFGKKKINLISRKDIFSFKDFMKKNYSSYNRCFCIIRSAFNKAEEWEFIPKNTNPCAKIPLYPEKKKERFLSPLELQEVEAILNSKEIQKKFSSYAISAIKLILYTGCRKNEVLSLKWEDVYIEDNYFHLKDAKAGERIVPLNDISKNILSKIERYADNPYVFPSARTNQCLTDIKHVWNDVRKTLGLEDVRIHDFRHSFASFAIKKGIDIFRVAKLLGHKDVKTTMRYAHISKEDMISASNVVGEMFGNG